MLRDKVLKEIKCAIWRWDGSRACVVNVHPTGWTHYNWVCIVKRTVKWQNICYMRPSIVNQTFPFPHVWSRMLNIARTHSPSRWVCNRIIPVNFIDSWYGKDSGGALKRWGKIRNLLWPPFNIIVKVKTKTLQHNIFRPCGTPVRGLRTDYCQPNFRFTFHS